jgi:putative oxygen-independent coproporphyrinogen III oxidase
MTSAAPAHGVYVHTPWCRIRCPYCAFYVETDTPRWTAWADGIRRHYDEERGFFSGPAEHLYFGGGTPSLAPAEVLGEVVDTVARTPDAEVTVEANPGTVDQRMLDALVSAGVNRLSVGIQTFQPDLARLLARAHSVHDASRLLQLVAGTDGLRSWSADLIFAVPGQTLDHLRDDLARLIDSGAPHVSIYGLSFEPGTPLTRARDQGRLQPLDADAWADQYALVVETLAAAGLERYEVSNFGRPDHHARHNEHVWRAGFYMGLGPSAHGYRPDGTRTAAPRDVARWLETPTGATERPSPPEAAIDFILSTLRHRDGIPVRAFEQRTLHTIQPDALLPFERQRLLARDEQSIRLGPLGWPVADGLVRAVVDAVVPLSEDALLAT